ncbi:hypothetical protein ACT721_11080, partial [Ornithobacterium rhinotracheale]
DVDGNARLRVIREANLEKATVNQILVVDKDGNIHRIPISDATLADLVKDTPAAGGGTGPSTPGGGSTATLGKTIASIRTQQLPMKPTDWRDNDYTVVVKGSGSISMPSAKANKGRILCVRNGEGTARAYFGADIPENNSAISGNRGQILQSDGEYWWVIGGF